MEGEKRASSQIFDADKKFFMAFCAKRALAMNTTKEDIRRRTPQSFLELQMALDQAVEQAHSSALALQNSTGDLQSQLQQYACELAKWKGVCRQLKEEVDTWKERCSTLEEVAKEAKRRLGEETSVTRETMEGERRILEAMNSDLREKLQQRERDSIATTKEDCCIVAWRFVRVPSFFPSRRRIAQKGPPQNR